MGVALNQNGFLFTFAVFLLVLGLLFFNSTVFQNTVSLEKRLEVLSLHEAGLKFQDIQRSLMDLDLSGHKKTLLERGLPFSYTADSNSISLTQNFPLLSQTLPVYFASLNGYRIFFLRQAKKDLAQGFELDINTIRDANWGGSSSQAAFVLLPFCVQYAVSLQRISLEKSVSSQCIIPFDPAHLRRLDLNILILDIREDFNRLACNGNGCPQDAFDSANPNPYYSVSFSAAGCPKCTFSPQTVSLHHAPGTDYNIFLACTNPPCDSEPFELLLNQFFVATRDSNKNFQFKASLQFDQNIQAFRSEDINFAVRFPAYGIIRTNDMNQLE